MNENIANNMDEYIRPFPANVQEMLQQLRTAIRQAAPDAQETISYGMPAFKQSGILVYFAGYKNHIGLYPTASGIQCFEEELKGYKTSKGTVQFPLDQPLPLDLVAKIVSFRVQENQMKAELKKKKNKK